MDSKRRTQILYDNPNSIFRANKKIYLHELQGATLKTKKPTPNELDAGLKTSEQMSMLITNLEKLKTIIDYFYGVIFDTEGFRNASASTSAPFIRDGISTIQKNRRIVKTLMKLPRSNFNEDDIFSITNILDYIVTTYEYIATRLDEVAPIMESYFSGKLFTTFIDELAKLVGDFQALLPYMDISGKIQAMDVRIIDHPQPEADFQDAPEGPPPDEDPLDLDPAPAPYMGAGRFNTVLSGRVRQIQRFPYKRFL